MARTLANYIVEHEGRRRHKEDQAFQEGFQITPRAVTCRICYKERGAVAKIVEADEHTARLHFHEPQFAITPGQSAVMYDGEVVVGGGVIEAA